MNQCFQVETICLKLSYFIILFNKISTEYFIIFSNSNDTKFSK